jgi:flagellar motor switch/type III secretory pathway protein FliN
VSSDFVPMELEPEPEFEAAALLDMPLRVWAEIGRVRMPAAFVVGMPQGAIVDLDCDPDAPADLFVNGRHFGTGRLVLVDGEWALRVETLDEDADGALPAGGGAGVEHLSSPAQQPPAAAD